MKESQPRELSAEKQPGVMEAVGRRLIEVRRDYPAMLQPDADAIFVAFLREYSRFGVFSLGPITISTQVVEERFARTHRSAAGAGSGTRPSALRFFELLRAESARAKRKGLDELTWLLTLMRLGEGLPGEVFGELGVSPEQVQAFAYNPATAAPGVPDLLSPEEAADYLRVHVQTVRTWIRTGKLKASRLAGQRALRIRREDLDAVLEPVDPSDFD